MIRITYEHIVEDTNQKISRSDGLKIDKTVLLNSIFFCLQNNGIE